MSKTHTFKVGDIVVCKKIPSNREESPKFISAMDKLVGVPMTVIHIPDDSRAWVRCENYSWQPKWLSKVSPAKVRTIKATERKAEAAKRRATAKLLAGLTATQRNTYAALTTHRDRFGCNFSAVVAVMQAALGCTFPAFESNE